MVANVNHEARQYYRGLKVQPKHVYGVSSKNVLVLLMYIIMRKNAATDWGTGKRPTLDEIEPFDLQLHHIFPFDYMTKNNLRCSSRTWIRASRLLTFVRT